ncbi:Rhodanese-like domain protein [Olavius algarvensis associated proteobacterium Delta 3]|nr:Rhodanese-like domain protein [Olavius algarvensis associated proteobacterium Delta 3]CAB5156748.1 Rhodanese-like domain protein [Olavius algarvensis associated proteobacterium Delta 3]
MRWRQFFTPIKAFNVGEAREYIAGRNPEDVTILDVRQPKEYRKGHLPGAKLIPLPELGDRFHEVDPNKPAIVY